MRDADFAENPPEVLVMTPVEFIEKYINAGDNRFPIERISEDDFVQLSPEEQARLVHMSFQLAFAGTDTIEKTVNLNAQLNDAILDAMIAFATELTEAVSVTQVNIAAGKFVQRIEEVAPKADLRDRIIS